MREISRLTRSEILKSPLSEFKLRLAPVYQSKLHKLFGEMKELHPTWKPRIWFSDDWYSPDGVGGFTIPVSLGHPRLMRIEKEYLGFCEGSSPTEFHKICCHETGHALDNAFKLRLNKRRQELFGKTSKTYPSSYIPKVEKNQYIEFLGDYYAQAHPDEDWAETVGYILFYGVRKIDHLPLKVRQKVYLANYILKTLKNKKPKKFQTQGIAQYTLPKISFEEYLLRKKQNFQLDKTSFFHPMLSQFKGQSISLDHKLMAEQITLRTNENPWVVKKCLKELKKGCTQQGIPLKYKYRQNNDQLANLIINNLEQFKQAGMTRVYM